jgi:hypothetical protein
VVTTAECRVRPAIATRTAGVCIGRTDAEEAPGFVRNDILNYTAASPTVMQMRRPC